MILVLHPEQVEEILDLAAELDVDPSALAEEMVPSLRSRL